MLNINRNKYSAEKLECSEWASILQQDGRSLMIRSLNLSKVELQLIPSIKHGMIGGKTFEEDINSEYVIGQLKVPGKIAMDAGFGYYFLQNPQDIPKIFKGEKIHFPGTIFCHKPYTRFWEPHCILQIYENKPGVWWHTYVPLHVLHSNDVFAYLPENARHQSDVIVTSFIDDKDPDENRF